MSITLPAAPAALPADTYAVRHRAWWEQCDVLLRQEDQALRQKSADDYAAQLDVSRQSAATYAAQLELSRQTAATEAQRVALIPDQIAASRAHGAAQLSTADAMRASVAAQREMAVAFNAAPLAPSDAQLLRDFMHSYVAAGAQDGQIAALAKARLAEFKAATAVIFSAP